jgi:hypothetical protein
VGSDRPDGPADPHWLDRAIDHDPDQRRRLMRELMLRALI